MSLTIIQIARFGSVYCECHIVTRCASVCWAEMKEELEDLMADIKRTANKVRGRLKGECRVVRRKTHRMYHLRILWTHDPAAKGLQYTETFWNTLAYDKNVIWHCKKRTSLHAGCSRESHVAVLFLPVIEQNIEQEEHLNTSSADLRIRKTQVRRRIASLRAHNWVEKLRSRICLICRVRIRMSGILL